MITGYMDFLDALKSIGFSMGGGNDEGIVSIVNWNWNEASPYPTPVRWHTGDPETDPWEWRMRVLEERNDIAYAKLFFKKSGYITAEWYPYFLAARRKGQSFADAYQDGIISYDAKQIYSVLETHGAVPLHLLKTLANMNGKENKTRFERALTDLQMRMYITMCARQQKQSQSGEAYGWFSTVFCPVETFFPEAVFEKAALLTPEEAEQAIDAQILRVNPDANAKQIMKFIRG